MKFRQAFVDEFDEPPSEELIGYFLQTVHGSGTEKVQKNDRQARLNLAKTIARGPRPTVAKLRKGFQKEFGSLPSDEIVQYFLGKIRHGAEGKELPDEKHDSREHFARTAADGSVSTVLQFRKTFEKVYGEPPAQDIIEIFIRHLPGKSTRSGN